MPELTHKQKAALHQTGRIDGPMPNWELARNLGICTNRLVNSTRPLVAEGYLRRFLKENVPCHELTELGRAKLQPKAVEQ